MWQIEDVIGLDTSGAVNISAKTGLGVDDVLEAIVTQLPAPDGDDAAPLKAMLVDSWYDAYLGVVVLVRIIDGTLKKGQKIRKDVDRRHAFGRPGGRVPAKARHGGCAWPRRNRLFHRRHQTSGRHPRRRYGDGRPRALRRYSGRVQAFPAGGFCGLFPTDLSQFEDLREAMAKLRLNDASFDYEMETSAALGFGFRCGFLGLLHLEIIRERIEREFDIDLITTAPSVVYHLHMNDGSVIELHNPADMPDVVKVDHIDEPWIDASILVPDEYLGPC
ncbi:MAG: hypothetical protein CM15mP55_2730 [Hyphomicrobiales bacterium]|nr:MAG: hypothetical protein CM15mP55_2730 [Hyphomicrobiales bacterium]